MFNLEGIGGGFGIFLMLEEAILLLVLKFEQVKQLKGQAKGKGGGIQYK